MTHPVFANTVAGDLAIGFSVVQHSTELGRLSEPAPRTRRGGGNLCDGAPSLLRPRADSQGARWEEEGEFRERRKVPLLGVPGSPPLPTAGAPSTPFVYPCMAGPRTTPCSRLVIPRAVLRDPLSPLTLTTFRPIRHWREVRPVIPRRLPAMHAGRKRPRDTIYVLLVLTATSKPRKDPKITSSRLSRTPRPDGRRASLANGNSFGPQRKWQGANEATPWPVDAIRSSRGQWS